MDELIAFQQTSDWMGIHVLYKVWHKCEGILPVYKPMCNMVRYCRHVMYSKEVPMRTWYSWQWYSQMTIREFLSKLKSRYASTLKESSVCTYTWSVSYHISHLWGHDHVLSAWRWNFFVLPVINAALSFWSLSDASTHSFHLASLNSGRPTACGEFIKSIHAHATYKFIYNTCNTLHLHPMRSKSTMCTFVMK